MIKKFLLKDSMPFQPNDLRGFIMRGFSRYYYNLCSQSDEPYLLTIMSAVEMAMRHFCQYI